MQRISIHDPTKADRQAIASRAYEAARAISTGREQSDDDDDDDDTEDSLDENEREQLEKLIKARTSRQLRELERQQKASERRNGHPPSIVQDETSVNNIGHAAAVSVAVDQPTTSKSSTSIRAEVSMSRANETRTVSNKSASGKPVGGKSGASSSKKKLKPLKSPLESMKEPEFRKAYPTFASYATYLALPSPTERHTIPQDRNAPLAGVRAYFMSVDKGLSRAIAINMENMVRLGGLAQPAFVSPFDAQGNLLSDQRGEATTHIIVFPPHGSGQEWWKFKEVMRQLQPILGKEADDAAFVGAAVAAGEDENAARERPLWVVRSQWLSECCKLADADGGGHNAQARKRSEYGFLVACEGDKKLTKANTLKRKRSSGFLDEDGEASGAVFTKQSMILPEETVNDFHFAAETEESTQEQRRREAQDAAPGQEQHDQMSQASHVLSAHFPLFESPYSFKDLEEEVDLVRKGADQLIDDDQDDPGSQEIQSHAAAPTGNMPDLLPSIRPAPVESDECDSGEEAEYREKREAAKWDLTKAARAAKKASGSKYRCDTSNVAAPLGQTSAGASTVIRHNDDVASKLDALASWYEKSKEHNAWWRVKGYRTAAGALRNCGRSIETYEDAIALPGIGEKTAVKIVEIVRTGRCTKLESKTPKEQVVEGLFTNIYGVGPSIANEWYNTGMRTLEDVRNSGRFGIILTEAQKLGVKHFRDLQERIPRAEVTKVFAGIRETAMAIDTSLQIECMGSYRRGQPDCGDIDIILTRDTGDGRDHSGLVQRLVEALLAQGTVTHTLSNPHDWRSLDAKWMGLCKGTSGKMRRIDILGVPYDELGAALIYFTGNDVFNRSLRLKARHLGYSLNQRGLFKDVIRDRKTGVKYTQGNRIASRTEQEIFSVLKTTWRPPNERLP